MMFTNDLDMISEGNSDRSSSGVESSKNSTSTGTDDKSGTSTAGSGESVSTTKGQLSRKETQNVTRLRFVVIAILFLAAAGVSALVYLVSDDAEQDEIASEFDTASTRLLEAFEAIRTERIATLASLAVAAIAHGVDHSRDWPFVSLSFYQQRAFTAKQNSGVLQVSIAPLVTQDDRAPWEEYIVSNEAEVNWIELSEAWQADVGADQFINEYGESFRGNVSAPHSIKRKDAITGVVVPLDEDESEAYLPLWETSPFLGYDDVNVDLMQDSRGSYGARCLSEGAIVIGDMLHQESGGRDSVDSTTSTYAQLLSIDAGEEVEYKGDPMTYLYIPIFDSFEESRTPAALLIGLFNWGNLFRKVLPETMKGIDLVLNNACYDPFTFRVVGTDVFPVGKGDLHESEFDSWEVRSPILEDGKTADGTSAGLGFVDRGCYYTVSIYPSQVFVDEYETSTPWILVSSVAGVMLFAILLFGVYDRLVERRQMMVLRKANQGMAIVSSLFPTKIRDRLMKEEKEDALRDKGVSAFGDIIRKRRDGSTDDSSGSMRQGETIADLFANTTVMFADIAGFTAWSSTRDPTQVFTLLQNLYQAFDKIALRRRVFKVETIGDSYVAVTGVPEPQKDHAIIMAKFARDCLNQMQDIMNKLEMVLGPGTADLSMRIGLNSGQVTGGVLRGDRARFQLFGDTVNTAARMESTGVKGKIQISESTADLLIAAGKEHWIVAREETVTAKGKGVMSTYFLLSRNSDSHQPAHSQTDLSDSVRSQPVVQSQLQNDRLMNWMSEVLLDYVKQIVVKNMVSRGGDGASQSSTVAHRLISSDTICLDELVESFALPEKNDEQAMMAMERHHSIDLDPIVIQQLQKFVREIASKYHEKNPFHNFNHACHVTLSVHKLLKRVVGDGTDDWRSRETLDQVKEGKVATYGILTSDPLTLFAIVFTALIHDVDHRGVSNPQMMKEEPELAEHYRKKSVAEQNSFDIAWDLLMTNSFDALRRAIFPTLSDVKRFRQVVVNIVLATDIFDKEMGAMRSARWDRVFGDDCEQRVDFENTKATIVLEHIMQASDVSHTMQHWHVYRKWNQRLFEEMRLAYKQGRMGADPSEFWYKGELGFFDNYVIPLANKLKECQVFGVSSDEYLNYALSNRSEWEKKGQDIVKEMIAHCEGLENED